MAPISLIECSTEKTVMKEKKKKAKKLDVQNGSNENTLEDGSLSPVNVESPIKKTHKKKSKRKADACPEVIEESTAKKVKLELEESMEKVKVKKVETEALDADDNLKPACESQKEILDEGAFEKYRISANVSKRLKGMRTLIIFVVLF